MQHNLDTLLQTLSHYKLFPLNRPLVVAVSGGADSIALLHWLTRYRADLAQTLHVATLNHGLRAEAADDVRYVVDIAQQLGCEVTTGRVDVPTYATAHSLGIEEAARRLRYDFLAKVAHEQATPYIATAHHADDQAETILMHILRGSGTNGLRGMQMQSPLPYHPQLTLLRPFLTVPRSAIDTYCQQHDLHPRQDPTNKDTTYTRNALRHEILPQLRRINPQINQALLRLSEITTVDNDFIEQQYQKICVPHITFAERVTVPQNEFQGWHRALQRQTFRTALAHLQVEPAFHLIETAIKIALQGQVGAIAELSQGVRLRVGYTSLFIEPADLPLPTGEYLQITKSHELTVPSTVQFDGWQLTISTNPLPDYDARLAASPDTKLILRPRQPKDRFQPLGMHGHSKSIKKWCIDRKIPRAARQGLPLVTIKGIIVAIVLPHAWEIAESVAVRPASQHIIYLKVSRL